MAKQIAARADGDTFQARYFWARAAAMLAPGSAIARLGFESGPKGFDDVWVAYHPGRGPQDARGEPLVRAHVQCKWHASLGAYGHKNLIDPDFINATSRSLLQRAHDAQQSHAPLGAGVRFTLATNWSIDRADALSPLIHTRHSNLRLDRLFDGKTKRSAAGALRKAWQEHLGIDDEGLRRLAGVLGFSVISDSLDDLRQHLDLPFQTAGLRRVPQHESAFIYDAVLLQWLGQDRLEFDAKTLRDRCRQEGLLGDATQHPRTYGVKSFEHAFDPLEERCDEVLNLLSHFQARYILEAGAWESDLLPALTLFLRQAGRSDPTLRLALDTHASLAFAAGSVLNIKSGRAVTLEQRTLDRRLWSAGDVQPDPNWPSWEFETQTLGSGQDLAVAVSLTHDTAPKVLQDLRVRPEIGQLLIARLASGPGGQVVASGRHAYDLAAHLATEIQNLRSDGASTHLFIAAPNGFTFFLGQRQTQLGATTLYEFDFESGRGGGYVPALRLPSGTGASRSA